MNELEFYKDLYKSTDIGYDAITRLMPKVHNERLRHDMALHMSGYCHFFKMAKEYLNGVNEEVKDRSTVSRLPAHIGMTMHTMFDSSPAHIAELMINGSNLSILDMRRRLNRLREQSGTEEAATLCQRVIDFEQDNVKRMQKYI